MTEQTRTPGFEPKALLHRHGGRVTSLLRIEHVTLKPNRPTWFFVGTVDWSDGSGDRATEVEISPTVLAVGSDEGNAEYDHVLKALETYLSRNGKWQDHGDWKPKASEGSAPFPGTHEVREVA